MAYEEITGITQEFGASPQKTLSVAASIAIVADPSREQRIIITGDTTRPPSGSEALGIPVEAGQSYAADLPADSSIWICAPSLAIGKTTSAGLHSIAT